MVLIAIAAFLVAAPFLTGGYLRYATRNARRAASAWTHVEQFGRVLLEDRRLPVAAGDVVEFILSRIGDGSLTRTFLMALLTKRTGRTPRSVSFDALMASLNREQMGAFLRFMISALFFDSLLSPLAGMMLRRFLYWLGSIAEDKTAPVSQYEVEPVFTAADKLCHA